MRQVETGPFVSMLRQLVEEGHEVSLLISGNSMLPFLIHERDTIYFKQPARPLKPGDMVFYQRLTGQYVMHRIYRIRSDGYYLLGDAQQQVEGPLRREQIFALVTKVRRKGKMLREGDLCWMFFQYFWRWLRPLRWKILSCYHKLKKLLHR